MLKTVFVIIFFPHLCLGQLIDENVMPFGGNSSNGANSSTYFTSEKLEWMHDFLGINQFLTGGFHGDQDTVYAKRFADAGIYVYPSGTYLSGGVIFEPQARFANATYFTTHPDSNDFYNVKFDTTAGIFQDSLLIYDGSGVMLGNLKMIERNNYDYLDQEAKLEYYPILKIGAYTSGLDDSTIIGIFKAWNIDANPDDLRFIDTLRVENLPSSGDTTLSLTNQIDALGLHYYHVLPDTSDSTKQMKFQFETTGACAVYVDFFRVYDQYGKGLIEDHDFDNLIYESVTRQGFDDRIRGWFLIDTPFRGSFTPVAYIDSLIQDATSGWSNPAWGPAWLNNYHAGSDRWVTDGFRDFERACRPKELWVYLFPFWLTTLYTGYSPPDIYSFQYSLEKYVTAPCDSIVAALRDYDTSFSWTYTPQYWYCDPGDDCDHGEERRKPTPSEMLCMTYIGMCYHPKSIVFYKYDTISGYGHGIMDEYGSIREGMGDVVMNDINPYLKAIDSTYLKLDLDSAYAVNYENSFGTAGTWIDTIYAVSDTPNPDRDWFHVGQFTEGSDKYIMIVNRACSSNEKGDPAPSVTATIDFNTFKLGMGNHVNIIDLARNTSAFNWVGTPDTTRVESVRGKITYSTVLGPGEGRLYKIEKTR